MKKTVSENQRLANRKNAQKSTGPKSPRGKARSAKNALTHGLLARDVVVTTPDFPENRADFDRYLADLLAEIKPASLIEQTLVERIATCYWRLRRAQRFEVGALRETLESPQPGPDELDALRVKLNQERATLDLERRLLYLFDTPADKLNPDETAELEKLLDTFTEQWRYRILEIDRPTFRQKLHERLPAEIADLEDRIAALRADLREAAKRHAMAQTRRPLTGSLPESGALLRVVRYETMLDRQIHRALAELRRLRKVPRTDNTRKKRTLRNEPI